MQYFGKIVLAIAALQLAACEAWNKNTVDNVSNTPVFSAKIESPKYPNLRTPKGANLLDLESPLRCSVNWNTQQMISTIPYNLTAFNMVRNGTNDLLPRFEVTGFSFETMPAEKALLKLTKEAGIKLVAKDAPYASISADNLRGELSEVIDMITEAAEIYYTYNANNKTLRISRKANFSLYVPQSRPILLAILDVLRGAGITDFTADFDDYSITFTADYELKNQVLNLINYFEENPILIAFDVRVFTLYPHNNQDIDWQALTNVFEFGAIKSSRTGVLGRVLTTSNDINVGTLNAFLGQQARVEPVAEGKFVVPNVWFSRFDIGKCASRLSKEAGLSVLAKASFEQNDKIFTDLTLESRDGEITSFDVRSKLGENFLIIGLPNGIFGVDKPKSETIVFMVPRIIKTLKTSKHLENNL
ncbi:MAG: hypothetical protein IJW72_06980 [Alphaproteobacteria bacterium]|nr:hypothetical protein [Alphaproteobacteria bacterium]